MGNLTHKWSVLAQAPRWNKDGGIWFVQPTAPLNGGPWQMYRWRPKIDGICESLLGHSIYRDGKIVGVGYPSPKQRHQIYRQGLELIAVFRDRTDFLSLAVYRQYVTQRGDIPLDDFFLELAHTHAPPLTPQEWNTIGERMPRQSSIRTYCFMRAEQQLLLSLEMAA